MLCSYFQNNECKKKSRNSRGKKRAMETRFYTMEFFSPFTRIFLYTSRKIPYNFFLCYVRISRVMNAKKLEIREGRQEQWKPTSTPWDFFVLSREVSYIHPERFLIIFFFMLCSYFQINECKKISKFKREDKSNGIPLLHHGIFFFFHENYPIYIQKDSS